MQVSTDSQEILALLGISPVAARLREYVKTLVSNTQPVLISGETGTGKSRLAHILHVLGGGDNKHCQSINIEGQPDAVLMITLFNQEDGLFQQDKGTVILENIHCLTSPLQLALNNWLDTLEKQSGTKSTKLRLICTTTQDVSAYTRTGLFMKELFFRLNARPVLLPPLRERKEDIPTLARFLVSHHTKEDITNITLHDSAARYLKKYEWEGNLRELDNYIKQVTEITDENTITATTLETLLPLLGQAEHERYAGLEHVIYDHLTQYFQQHQQSLPPAGLYKRFIPVVERQLIRKTLEATEGNQLKTAHILGINRNTLRKKIAELGIMAHAKL